MTDLIASDDPGLIVDRSRVTLHFALRLPAGEVVDSNFDRAPATLQIGDGNMLPGFEKRLIGLQVGDEKRFQVEPEDAFGPRRDENLRQLPRSQFDQQFNHETTGPIEPGLMVSFAGPGGELPGVVSAVGDSLVTVDFNHPLAGFVILFDVAIVAVDNGG